MKANVFFALLVLFPSCLFVHFSIVDMQNIKRLDESGVKVMSEPVTEYAYYQSEKIYRVSFFFKVNRKTRRCFGKFNKHIIAKLKLHPVLEVTYLPDDLSVCRIKHEEAKFPPLLSAIIATISALCALGYLYNLFTATRNNN